MFWGVQTGSISLHITQRQAARLRAIPNGRPMSAALLAIIYLAFVSLGLPDGLLGAAWPTMHVGVDAAVSWAGIVSTVICLGTIVSSLLTNRLVRRMGTGVLTASSVALTAAALFGFSTATEFWQLVLWAIPYGLGAGAVDAALNAFVATHYEARHMNWLHCCWGIGAAGGPLLMAAQISHGAGWQVGYQAVGLIQVGLVVALVLSLRLWGARVAGSKGGETDAGRRAVSRSRMIALPGVPQALVGFFCYCALEASCGLWAPTFLVLGHGLDTGVAALLGSLFYAGITCGRFVSGVLTLRLTGTQLLRLGEAVIASGVATLLLAPCEAALAVGLVLLGVGCAPIYPQMIQLTPTRFGTDNAQALMGLQMACAYVGSMAMPPLVGMAVENASPLLLPPVAAVLLAVMTVCLGICDKRTAATHPSSAM